MKKLPLWLALLIGFSFLFISYLINEKRDEKNNQINDKYFAEFNNYFSGTIIDIKEDFGNHTCMIYIDIDSANTINHDIRELTDSYYCVIKDNKAEVIESIRYGNVGEPKNWIQKGNRFVFDGRVDSVYLYDQSKLIKSWQPRLREGFWVKIRRHHRL